MQRAVPEVGIRNLNSESSRNLPSSGGTSKQSNVSYNTRITNTMLCIRATENMNVKVSVLRIAYAGAAA